MDLRVYSGLIEATGSVRVDLLERLVRMRPFTSLRAGLRYRVYLSAAVRGLNGIKLPAAVVFDFTTGDQEDAPRPPPSVAASSLQPTWSERCTSCHAGAEPAMGVDLSSPDSVLRTLRGVPSSAGPLRVIGGDHARSYLMRKLLGEGGIVGPPMPPDGPLLPAPRLREVADWIDSGAAP